MSLEVDAALVVAQELKRPLLELRQLAFGFDGNGESDEKIRLKMINVADKAIRQMNDLAKFEKLSRAEYGLSPVAVRALCDDVVDEISELFNGRKGEITVRYCNRSRLVMANSELLKSVIYNLLADATNYTDAELKTELRVKQMGQTVEINVRDFGPALPFDMWQEVKGNFLKPRDIAMRPGSSALGLYIVSKFAKYMNGKVGAVRHRDGVSFFVRIPVPRQMNIWGTE